MRTLLDTTAYSAFKRKHEGTLDLIRRSEEVLLPTVAAGELLAGFHGGSRFQANLRELQEFLDHPWVRLVPSSFGTADRYGRIYVQLRRQGTPIPSNDIWVAASAMETGAHLAALDGHFEHVPGLAWVDLR